MGHHLYTARRKPLLSLVLVFGLCIFSVMRSSQTVSSLQNHTRENFLGKIFNQTEEYKNEAADNRRRDDQTKNRGGGGSSRHFWEREDNPSCFHLNKICHGNGAWFYDDVPNNHVTSSPRMLLNQPSINYSNLDVPEEYDPDERYRFNVASPLNNSQNKTAATCPYSSTPYHIVVQSYYNHMIGEFYSRTVRGLNEWMRDFPPKSEEDIQLYVHMASEGRQTLFHGHRLFLGALPQSDKIDSFLSLIENKRCQCFEKLVFCGYKLHDYNLDDDYDNDDTNMDDHLTFFTADKIEHLDSDETCDGRGFRKGNRCTAYNHLRQDLLSRYERKDPLLHEKIRDYRHNMLLENGVAPQQIGNVDDWKIVGLTDRKARRVWLNIDEVIQTCETNFLLKKVLCIKVNVEEANSTQAQLLMHMSLDSMIGIHGAQLTHGVLLPQEGFILEILPWIPHNISDYGEWTATTDRPTPLGEIFHGTNLHHLGFRLGRESVPMCEHLGWSDRGLKACLMNETNENNIKFDWSNRDFNVDVNMISKFIASFLLKDIPNCSRMYKRAEENFVIYNTYCSKGEDKVKRAKQYFHSRSRARQYKYGSRQDDNN
eukprot:scaffold6449_cov148-Skeletonema_menzelii.AAC.4